MSEIETEAVTEEIAEAVAEVATDLIAEAEHRADVAEEIMEAVIDAAIETEENRLRREFEERILAALAETNEGLRNCQSNLETLQSTVNNSLLMATEAATLAETSLTLQASNPQSESADAPQEVAEILIEPESQQAPETSEPPPATRKRRLL